MKDALKINTAAKAWLALLGVAAQVALSYFPDHGNVWYNATQGLVAVLGVIGVYAIPNRDKVVADLKAAADDVAAMVTPALTPVPAPVVPAAVDATVTVAAAPVPQPADVPAAEPAVAAEDQSPAQPAVAAQDPAAPVPAQ